MQLHKRCMNAVKISFFFFDISQLQCSTFESDDDATEQMSKDVMIRLMRGERGSRISILEFFFCYKFTFFAYI